jgi:hypothetical protein
MRPVTCADVFASFGVVDEKKPFGHWYGSVCMMQVMDDETKQRNLNVNSNTLKTMTRWRSAF